MNTTPESTQHRSAGIILLLIGLAFAIGDGVGWQMTGHLFAYLIAVPIVLVPAGLFMAITGKNPFKKLR